MRHAGGAILPAAPPGSRTGRSYQLRMHAQTLPKPCLRPVGRRAVTKMKFLLSSMRGHYRAIWPVCCTLPRGNIVSRQKNPVVMSRRRHRLAVAIATASLSFYAVAETATDADVQELGEVMVVGQAASISNALDVQTAAGNIESVVHADGIGQLPDTNVAEALQRVPGVSTERDQGEGRFVRVRGLGPDLNTVTVNGSLIPSPESDRRAVAMDVIPADIIQSLTVVKTLTPDMDANSLGGTIEVKTLSAFDHDALFYSLEAEASQNTNVDQTSPKLSAVWSDRVSEQFGIAAGISWEKRDFGSDNVESGGAWDFEQSEPLLEEFERRDYEITRERLGTVLNLDWKGDNASYYLRTLYSEYTDTENRQAHKIEFDDAQPAGALGDAESERELKDREETQKVLSLVLGMQQKFGLWTLDAAAGHGKSSEDEPAHIASGIFAGDNTFNDVGFSDSAIPRLNGPAAINEASAFSLKEVEVAKTHTEDTESNLRFDLTRDIALADDILSVKFGAKASRREKTTDAEAWLYEDFDTLGFTSDELLLTQFQGGSVDYSLGQYGPRIDAGRLNSLIAGLDAAAFYDEEESRINDFTMNEDINAGYLQASYETGPWRVLAGVRYEGTQFEAQGTGLDNGSFVPNKVENDFGNWLPGLHLRREFGADTAVRAAWTNAVVRPTFGQLAPGYVIDGDEAEFGNPLLKPLESSNLDLGIEHRMGRAGVLSAYVFYKDIKNFVYNTDVAGTGIWSSFNEALTFANGDSAEVKGLELAWSQSFGGFLLGANATFSSSDATISRFDSNSGQMVSRDIPLPSQSDTTANLVVGYENERFSLRLAGNYKSEYLLEVTDVLDAPHDLYVDAQTQLDFTGRIFLGKHAQIVLQALNLNDEPYYVYTGRNAYNAQYEEYGPTYKLGINFTHF